MIQKITLYVDGACRGNPGLGGWGAYIVTEQEEHKMCGGESDTTNNRMELTAAIEGISFCPIDAELTLWTDSNYVKRGITEWIQGWKKKNWKDVKNPDLWQKLDTVCQGRRISWNWVKGHAGHAGNEMADSLANNGADQTAQGKLDATIISSAITESAKRLVQNAPNAAPHDIANTTANTESATTLTKKKADDDWLLNDPFGFDLMDQDEIVENDETISEQDPEDITTQDKLDHSSTTVHALDHDQNLMNNTVQTHEILENSNPENLIKENDSSSDISHELIQNNTVESTAHETPIRSHDLSQSARVAQKLKQLKIQSHIVITEPTLNLQGPRQLILDTETTGFYYQEDDRIIEVGAIEMINRKLTGSSIHIYINPKKPVGDSENVHGISDEFLKDKPLYAEIADILFEYLEGAEIIAHNATFDMNFLDMEFKRAGFSALSDVCTVTDTLVMAKSKHPGQKNSLDALVRRYEVPQRDRTFHGALLDAEILADVYLAMTGGQVSFDMDALSANGNEGSGQVERKKIDMVLPVIYANSTELEQHENWVKQYQEKHGQPCLFGK